MHALIFTLLLTNNTVQIGTVELFRNGTLCREYLTRLHSAGVTVGPAAPPGAIQDAKRVPVETRDPIVQQSLNEVAARN